MSQPPKPTSRVRGVSFKKEYMSAPPQQSLFDRMKARLSGNRPRQPSMVHDLGKMLVPKKDPAMEDRLTIVLDLDETIIYAREGPLYARPGLQQLLTLIHDKFEGIVWTAGVKAYAQAVLRNVDKKNVIQHCVYRHKKWFSGQAGYNKDLTLLGRDMSSTLIIENTPDCVRGNEENGVLVSDYEGREDVADNTIPAIVALLEDLYDRHQKEKLTVPEYIQSSKLLVKQTVPTDRGDSMTIYCLNANDPDLFVLQKETRVNKDLIEL